MANGRNFTTSFNANTSGLKKGTDEVINKLNELNKKLVDNQYKQRDSNKVISDAKRELKKLQEQIKDNDKATDDEKKKIQELNDTIEQEKLKLSQLRTEQISIKNIISETSKEISGNTKEWTVLKATLANLASDTLEIFSSKLLSVGKDIIQTGEQFSSSMSEVAAISGASAEELEKIRQAARQFGSETVFSASESAEAFKFMALAGWDAEKSIAAIPGVLALAAASGMSLGQSADMVTDYLSAYSMAAEQAAYLSDLLTYAQGHSNTSAQQLGEAWKNCAANLNAAGQDVETVTSILEAMANQGYKGSEAGTSLSAIMRDITDKMKNGSISIGEINVAVRDAEGNFRDLTDILADIEKAVDGMGTAEKSAALSTTFTQDSIKGLNLVLNEGIGKVRGYEDALRQSMGSADSAAQTMSDNLTGDIKILESALDDLKLGIYDGAEQPIRKVVQAITRDGVPALKALLDNIDKIIPVVLTAAAAMGSYKASLAVQSILKGVQQGLAALTVARGIETAAVKAETSAQVALNTAQAANPIGLLVAAVGGLAAGIGALTLITNSAAESTRNYNEELKQLKDTADQTVANAEGEANVINALSERYEELRSKQNRTKSDEYELVTISEQLAEKLGVTTDSLKEQNGEYKSLADNVEAYTQKLVIQAKMEAAAEMIRQATVIRMKAEREENEKLLELINKGIYEYDEEGIARVTDKWGEDEAGVKKLHELGEASRSAAKAVDDYTNSYQELVKEFAKFKEKSDDTAKAVKNQSLSFSEEKEELDKLREAMQEAGEEAKKAKEDIDKAVSGALSNVQRSAQNLQKVQAEIKETGKVSLSTLSSIASAYPELNSLLNEYCNGLKNEGDIIKALEKVYQNDVDSYNQSVRQKEILTDGYVKAAAKASSELVDKYKEHYGIDLRNFANAAEAKAEIEKNLYEKMAAAKEKYNALSDKYYTTVENGEQILMVKDKSAPDGVRRANVKEISDYNAVRSGYFKSQDDFYSFDIEEFQKQLAADVAKYYKDNSVSADDLLKGFTDTSTSKKSDTSTSKKSDTSSSGKSETKAKWTMNARNVYAEGDTYIKAYVNWIERVKNLGKLTVQEEISILQNLLARSENTADERYDIEYRLYKAKENLQKEQDEKQKQLEEAAQKRAKDAADALLERQKLALAAYNRLVENKIDSLKAESDAAKESADKQIAALDAVMAKRKQEQEDAKRQKELDVINAKLRYQQMTDFERRELQRRKQEILNEQAEMNFERSIENQKAAINSTASSIQTKNAQAISGLQSLQSQFSDRMAAIQGNQTYDQRVSNNSKTVNIQIVQNGMSDDQLLNKLLRDLG